MRRFAVIRTIGGSQFNVAIGDMPFLQWWDNVRLDHEVRTDSLVIRVAGIETALEVRDDQKGEVTYLRPVVPDGEGPPAA